MGNITNLQIKFTMASTQITFTSNQIAYLREWFATQSKQYVGTVMDDDFEADEENFERLCMATFNINGFQEGVMETSTRNVKVKKQRKKKDPYEPKMRDYIATKEGTNDTKEGTNDTNEGSDDDESQETQFDGFTKCDGKFISGYSSAGKTKFDSLQSAIDAFQEDSGGIVYDGNKYTIRKIGTVKNSTKNETLWIKK